MRNMILVAIFLVVFIVSFLILRKKCQEQKPVVRTLLSLVIALAIPLFLALFPVESALVKFDSPQAAFRYVQSGEPAGTAEGESSCMVLYQNDRGQWGSCLLPREGQTYGVPGAQYAEKLGQTVASSGFVCLYRAQGTEDYYIWGFLVTPDGEACDISDNKNSKIEKIVQEGEDGYSTVVYWACIKDPGESCEITVDGEKAVLELP